MQLSTFQNRIMTASSQLKQMISDSCDPEKKKEEKDPIKTKNNHPISWSGAFDGIASADGVQLEQMFIFPFFLFADLRLFFQEETFRLDTHRFNSVLMRQTEKKTLNQIHL